MTEYIPIIGLEVHVQPTTQSKMFCGCSARTFRQSPNAVVCPVCLGLPGSLPVPNLEAIRQGLRMSLALNCRLSSYLQFDRKHYFYPDLPKGYQITQHDHPLGFDGSLQVKEDSVGIKRVHLEEDTGKLIHQENETLVDFNRSGLPLLEIVTEPDLHSADEAEVFLRALHELITSLNVSQARMEEGTMRLEPNISLSSADNVEAGILPDYKVEIKNINSFKYARRAIDFEIKRQEELLRQGKSVLQETRGFNEKEGITVSQRSKEEAHDYRYFPEPDIPITTISNEIVDSVRVDLTKMSKEEKGFATPVPQKHTVPSGDKLSQTETIKLVDIVMNRESKAISDYHRGKPSALQYLLGCVMRESKNQANVELVRRILTERLGDDGIKI